MKIDRRAFIYDDERPGDVAPEQLWELFDNMDNKLDEYIDSHPSFDFDSYLSTIEKHRESMKSATKSQKRRLLNEIRDLEWMMVNHRSEAKNNLLLWEYPRSVHSVKARLVRGKLEWTGLLWKSKHERESVDLTDEYVKYLLTSEAYKKKCFRSDKFVALQKYDRQTTVNETHFRGVRKIDQYHFQVVDCQGQKVKVSTQWAFKNLNKESVREAIESPPCDGFRLIPLGCPCAKDRTDVGNELMSGAIDSPLIMYRQVGRQHKCMQKCFASALHYMGHHEEAAIIGLSTKASSSHFDGFKSLVLEVMKRGKRSVRYRKAGRYHPLDLADRRDNPIIASLKAATMEKERKVPVSINHSVCFLGDYVFDANQDRALVISDESLNQICDAVVPGSFYDGIYWSRELIMKVAA